MLCFVWEVFKLLLQSHDKLSTLHFQGMNAKCVCERRRKTIPKPRKWFTMRMRHVSISAATRTVFLTLIRFPWQRVTAAIRVVPERAARSRCGARPAIQVREEIKSIYMSVITVYDSRLGLQRFTTGLIR